MFSLTVTSQSGLPRMYPFMTTVNNAAGAQAQPAQFTARYNKDAAVPMPDVWSIIGESRWRQAGDAYRTED